MSKAEENTELSRCGSPTDNLKHKQELERLLGDNLLRLRHKTSEISNISDAHMDSGFW